MQWRLRFAQLCLFVAGALSSALWYDPATMQHLMREVMLMAFVSGVAAAFVGTFLYLWATHGWQTAKHLTIPGLGSPRDPAA